MRPLPASPEHPLSARTIRRGAVPDRSWIIGAISLGSALWLAVTHARDFHVYWQAGRALGSTGWEAVYQTSNLTPFKYHPLFALVFAPFGLVPEPIARVVWAVVNGLMLYDAQSRWRRSWRLDPVAIGLGFVAIFHAATWQYLFGNVTFAMLWIWTVALTTASVWIEATAYAALIALKPFWLALILGWLVARRFSLVPRVTIALGTLSLVPLMAGWTSGRTGYARWFATLADPAEVHNFAKPDNQSWYGWLARQVDPGSGRLVVWWLAGSGVIGLLWAWRWRHAIRHGPPPDRWRLEASLVPFILWTAPLSWIHHQILLWPLLALAWQVGRSDRWSMVVYATSFGLLTVIAQTLIGRAASTALFNWGVPLLAFVLLTAWAGDWLGSDPPREPAA
jgi:hypothetical protein